MMLQRETSLQVSKKVFFYYLHISWLCQKLVLRRFDPWSVQPSVQHFYPISRAARPFCMLQKNLRLTILSFTHLPQQKQLTSNPKYLNWWWKFKWNVRREIKEDHVSCSLSSDTSSFLQQSEIVGKSDKLCNQAWYFFFFLIQNISETIFCGRFLFSPLRTSSFWDSVCHERGRKEL